MADEQMSQMNEAGANFRRIVPSALDRTAIIANCLDDQWIDRDTLLSQGDNYRRNYTANALAEFSKCLLSAKQIVVNRSYLQNTGVMRELVRGAEGPQTLPIVRLVGAGDVVPYLYDDESPSLSAAAAAGTIQVELTTAWNTIVAQAEPKLTCVRLSWGKNLDSGKRRKKLNEPFSERLENIARHASPDCLHELSRNVDAGAVKAFDEYLRGKFLDAVLRYPNRTALYRDLVIVEDSPIALTKIDAGKEFAKEAKQIIDTVYNANLAGALDVDGMTPSGAASAQMFADQGLSGRPGKRITSDFATDLVLQASLMQRDFHLAHSAMLGRVSMEDVMDIRDHAVWKRYINAVGVLPRIDVALGDDAFAKALSSALENCCVQAEALLNHLNCHYSRKRQLSGGTGRVLMRSGGVALGAALGTAIDPVIGGFTGGLVAGAAQETLEKIAHRLAQTSPARTLALQMEPMGKMFAAWRYPPLRFDRGRDTLERVALALQAREPERLQISQARAEAPVIEAEPDDNV